MTQRKLREEGHHPQNLKVSSTRCQLFGLSFFSFDLAAVLHNTFSPWVSRPPSYWVDIFFIAYQMCLTWSPSTYLSHVDHVSSLSACLTTLSMPWLVYPRSSCQITSVCRKDQSSNGSAHILSLSSSRASPFSPAFFPLYCLPPVPSAFDRLTSLTLSLLLFVIFKVFTHVPNC